MRTWCAAARMPFNREVREKILIFVVEERQEGEETKSIDFEEACRAQRERGQELEGSVSRL
jgi:hypothetical protein